VGILAIATRGIVPSIDDGHDAECWTDPALHHAYCEDRTVILNMTRSQLILTVGDEAVTIKGEACLRGHGSPDFVAYSNTISTWNQPHDGDLIDDEIRKLIIERLLVDAKEQGITIEVE
jgi:hypothetical protein